jgi:hypothetical protein
MIGQRPLGDVGADPHQPHGDPVRIHRGEGHLDGILTFLHVVGDALEHVLGRELHPAAVLVAQLRLQEVVVATGVGARKADHEVDHPDVGGHHPESLSFSFAACASATVR